MSVRGLGVVNTTTLTPFLYPVLLPHAPRPLALRPLSIWPLQLLKRLTARHYQNQISLQSPTPEAATTRTSYHESHLNPSPESYSRPLFQDAANITIASGGGGHGCISFLREKYIAAGPPNGGDGGSGGNVYIQAVHGETSLHKLARRGTIRAGRGRNGQGKTRGGERGEDIIIKVPVGTVIRELTRHDPVAIEDEKRQLESGTGEGSTPGTLHNGPYKWSREKWLLYPAVTPEDVSTAEFPSLPRARRSALQMAQPAAPIQLDLSKAMQAPMLLVAGASGGMGNTHFVTREVPRPKYATKGESGTSVTIELELKLLADVGLVGLPNAGKSTLLRALSNSRTRIGDWAFTTLQPNIGTVVLDDHKGRGIDAGRDSSGERRTSFTIADIPGLVRGAHLDRGLGISFLRHVERARVLAFVIDLNAGDPVDALKALWNEVGLYDRMKREEDEERELAQKEELVKWSPFSIRNEARSVVVGAMQHQRPNSGQDGLGAPSVASKPWFVIATKADLPETKAKYGDLKAYVNDLNAGMAEYPSRVKHGWNRDLEVIPVSAINRDGVSGVTDWLVRLLKES